jgi:DNA invertase Pin-like site-specific DNA recombinase
VRVSTHAQTVENQIRELSHIAERCGWEVIEIYRDAGISGAKGAYPVDSGLSICSGRIR